MARCYNNLFGLRSTGLRFFTVYGPWGRPDMAYYIFTKDIKNKNINLFNHGDMFRDFTFIDDIVFGIKSAIKKIRAEKIGKDIKAKLGVNYRILYRPL